jgi:hypothetical protein
MNHGSSIVTAIAGLEPGGSVCYSRFIASNLVSATLLHRTKRNLTNTLTKAVSRAKQRNPDRTYRIYSLHNFTAKLDLVVTTVIVREMIDEG